MGSRVGARIGARDTLGAVTTKVGCVLTNPIVGGSVAEPPMPITNVGDGVGSAVPSRSALGRCGVGLYVGWYVGS